MSKCLVKNTINNRTYGFALPCGGAEAKAFCDNALEGTYVILTRASEQGNSSEASVVEYTITGKNNAGNKTTFSFYTKPSVDDALAGKTFNGVKFDEIYVISAKKAK